MSVLPRRIKRMIPTKGSLTGRMMSASAWSSGSTVIVSMMRLGSNLITTRLLYPEAFGLVAMITTIHVMLAMMTDVGLVHSIVREKDGDSPRFLNVTFTLRIMVGFLIAAAMLLCALALWWVEVPFAAPDSVLADPLFPALLAMGAVVPIIGNMTSPGLMVAKRRLDFRTIAKFEVVCYALGIALTITALYIYPSVWMMVLGLIFHSVLRMTLSYIFFETHRLELRLDRDIVARHWGFGRFVLLSSPLEAFFLNGDKFVLGVLIDATLFGLYSIGMVWVVALRTALGKTMAIIGYSGIAELLRERPEVLPSRFAKFRGVLTVANFASFVGLVIGGPYLIAWLYTEEYVMAGGFLMIMSATFLFQRFIAVETVLLAQGLSKQCLQHTFLRAMGIIILAPLGNHLAGTTGAVVGVSLAGACSAPLAIYRAAKFMPARHVWADIAYLILALGLIAAIAVSDPLG